MTMLPLKAHVKNGRLVLDEPTDRPEGEEIELIPLEERLEPLTSEQRAVVDAWRAGGMIDSPQLLALRKLAQGDALTAEEKALLAAPGRSPPSGQAPRC